MFWVLFLFGYLLLFQQTAAAAPPTAMPTLSPSISPSTGFPSSLPSAFPSIITSSTTPKSNKNAFTTTQFEEAVICSVLGFALIIDLILVYYWCYRSSTPKVFILELPERKKVSAEHVTNDAVAAIDQTAYVTSITNSDKAADAGERIFIFIIFCIFCNPLPLHFPSLFFMQL